MAKAHYLTDKDGNKFYPNAHASATYMADGTTVATKLGTIDTSISGKVNTSTTVNGKALNQNISLSASDVGALANTTTHLSGDIASTEKGANNGVATLGNDGKIPESQLPSFVSDIKEYANKASFPATGQDGKIYVAKDTNLTYRWSGSAYVEVSPSIALGETSSTAYAGDKGKANATAISTINTKIADMAHITTDGNNYSAGDSVLHQSNIVDNLTTDVSTNVLSAKQGKILNDSVSALNNSLNTTELTTTKSIDGISKLKAFKYGKIVVVNIGINVPVLSDGTVIGNIGTSIKDKAYMTTANYNATLNVFTIETNGDIKCNGATRSASYSGATVTVITD